jgi:hypothetical protein
VTEKHFFLLSHHRVKSTLSAFLSLKLKKAETPSKKTTSCPTTPKKPQAAQLQQRLSKKWLAENKK